MVPIVNEDDEIIGHKERKDITTEDIFRVAGVWVTDPEGNIFLAQRSFNKDAYPGTWAIAAAGLVEGDESYEVCAIREAEEEIGLTGVEFIYQGKRTAQGIQRCHATLYSAVVPRDYPFVKQDEEVEAFGWFTKEEVLQLLKERPETCIPNFQETVDYFKLL